MDTLKETRSGCQSMWLRFAALVLVLELSGYFVGNIILTKYADRSWFTYAMTILINYVIGFPVIYFLMKGMPAVRPEAVRMSFGGLLAAFILCVLFSDLGTLIGLPLSKIFSAASGSGSDSLTNVQNLLVNGSPVWNIILVVILAPVFEELIFRRLLIDHVYQYGEVIAILASALAFGLFHRNVSQLFYTALLGLVLAYVYVRTGNIFYTIGIHMAFNLFGVIAGSSLTGLDLTELSRMTALTPEMMTAMVPLFLVLTVRAAIDIAGVILLIRFLRKKKLVIKETPKQVPKGKGAAAFGNIGFLLYAAIVTASVAVKTFL